MTDRYGNKVCELLEDELSEYPFYEDWTFEFEERLDGWEYYTINIRGYCFNHLIRVNKDKIQVDVAEGIYKTVKTYDWTIKYFWMAILDSDYLV